MTETDVVIAVYGGADHLQRCLFALGQHRPAQARVYIIDDATPESQRQELKAIYERLPDWARLTVLPKNRGFAGANNIGVGLGSSPYVCLLNSDTEPQAYWLEAMTSVLDCNPNVAIVGAKLLYPAWSTDPARPKGRIQHAGVAFNVARLPYHIFLGWQADHPKVNRFLLMQAVTGACWLVRREVYESLNGLDESFGQGNFEDIDFCLRVKQMMRMDVAYCPAATLWHYGSGSNNTAVAQKNARLFLYRWEDKVEYDDWLYW